MDKREIHPIDRGEMVGILVWLERGRFIEEDWGDIYEDTVSAFSHVGPPRKFNMAAVERFLQWMDYGDRLRRIGPDNPHGENIEFYCSDYPTPQVAAEEMVAMYEQGV